MRGTKKKRKWSHRKCRLLLMWSSVIFVAAALLLSTVWSHNYRMRRNNTVAKNDPVRKAETTKVPNKTAEPMESPTPSMKPTEKPDETKKLYTYLQGPKSWKRGIDWSGEWGEQYMDGGSFGGFGCGMCCMANVYSSLTEYQCSPVDMYRFAKKHTGYGGGMAIDWGYMRRSLTRLGFQCHVEHKQETYRQFRQNISDAKCAIVLVSSSNSTVHWKNTPGHYVTIFAYDKKHDRVFLADSGDPDHNRKWISLKKIYRSLKTASNWQYLLVEGYQKSKDIWKHKTASGVWNRPAYLQK